MGVEKGAALVGNAVQCDALWCAVVKEWLALALVLGGRPIINICQSQVPLGGGGSPLSPHSALCAYWLWGFDTVLRKEK